ncbi:VOC family protein [Streptomyces sp. B21-083]|uniref:VOC family protein n=1 Tax=Streptomyces sp. B21-083 TaxID=3039410 RepID=UPI002FF092C0
MTATAATPKLAHLVLQTNQLQAMRDWYRTVLKAHVVFENPMMVFLTFDEEHHRIALMGPIAGPLTERTPMTVGLQHSAYTFPELGSLMYRYEELKAAGVEPRLPLQHGFTTSLYYRDPDGNHVELQVDNFSTAKEATAYLEGPEYEADPIGVVFDPTAMAEAVRAGVSEKELLGRAWAEDHRLDLNPVHMLLG